MVDKNKERQQRYRDKHREEIREREKIWAQTHKEKIKENSLSYRKTHKEYNREQQRKFSKTPKGKLLKKKGHAIRRELGFITLNDPLPEDCEGHHIDRDYVIYIPKSLHRSLNHNVRTGYNMDIINDRVYDWFIQYYHLE